MKVFLLALLLIPAFAAEDPLDSLGMIPLPERKKKAAQEWWRYSDDLVTFELPGYASRVELKNVESDDIPKPNNRRMSSSMFSNEPRENPFARVYTIRTKDGGDYGAVKIEDQPWFDEFFCFCGPIALRTFEIADGNLLQFSQMPDGFLKSVQAINGVHRVMVREWTHSQIPFDEYERIGASLRLKKPSERNRLEWISLTRKKREMAGEIGWLRLGMPVQEIRSMMGPPLREGDGQLVYESRRIHDDGNGFLTRMIVPVVDGRLVKPDKNWLSNEEVIPPHRVTQEIESFVQDWGVRNSMRTENPRHPQHGKPFAPPENEMQQVLDSIRRDAPLSKGRQWMDWCKFFVRLDEAGFRNENGVELVARRISEKDLPQREALKALEFFGVSIDQSLVRQRLDHIVRIPGDGRAGSDDFYEVASWLEKEGQLPGDPLRSAALHPDHNSELTRCFSSTICPVTKREDS